MRRLGVLTACAALAAGATGCSDASTALERHRRALRSLSATTEAVVTGWLAGQLPGTYAHAALQQTFQLNERQRTALAVSPEALHDPRAVQLIETAEELGRLIAALTIDVTTEDATMARRHIRQMPLQGTAQP